VSASAQALGKQDAQAACAAHQTIEPQLSGAASGNVALGALLLTSGSVGQTYHQMMTQAQNAAAADPKWNELNTAVSNLDRTLGSSTSTSYSAIGTADAGVTAACRVT
jgi:hypothetical protein